MSISTIDMLVPAPQNAVVYEIRASTDVLSLTAAGLPKSGSIAASLYKVDGATQSLCADFDARLYVYNSAGNELHTVSINDSNAISVNIENMSNIFKVLIKWFAGTDEVASKEIPTVKDGSAGAPGSAGPLIYPAGIFDPAKSYTRTVLTAPYVGLSGLYYLLSKEGTYTGINPADDYAANGQSATWKPYENFQAAFFEIFMAEFGSIGKATFFNEFMMSQYGVDANGNSSTEFENFSDNTFVPNILFNFLTGAGHLCAGNFSWDQYGRTFRKSREIILWRYLSNEIPVEATEYNLNLKQGTYFYPWGTDTYCNLPDPALHQGLELEFKGPAAITRTYVPTCRFRCLVSLMVGYNPTLKESVDCNSVQTFVYGSSRVFITSEQVNGQWRWVADSGFNIFN